VLFRSLFTFWLLGFWVFRFFGLVELLHHDPPQRF